MNPYPASVVMERMARILKLGVDGMPPLPNFVQKGGDTYVERKYAMSQGTLPSCLIEAGQQQHTRNSQRTHEALLQITISVYDQWQGQDATLDDLRVGITSDIELLMATLQANENLVFGNEAMASSIPRYTISAYRPETEEPFLGMHLVLRSLTAYVNVLPYDE